MTTSHVRSGTLAAAVLVAAVAVLTSELSRVSAQQLARPNYSFDTRFELKPGAAAQFDRYWMSVRALSARGADPYRRYIDGTADGRVRLVSLPVRRLAEYHLDRRTEDRLRATLGPSEAEAVLAAFNDSQMVRFSYIRQYLHDLSVNDERREPRAETEVVSVTVGVRQEREFERVWRRATEAYRRIPGSVLTVARTLAGDGPQFVISRPVRPGTGETFDPVDGVRATFGDRAAQAFAEDLRRVVTQWASERVVNLGLDSEPGTARQ